MHRSALLSLVMAALSFAADRPSSCKSCPEWNIAQKPFPIYGNSYYVGTHGLSSVLVTSPTGYVLIDGALPESAPRIAENIRALGFRLKDVKLIVNSHVHFDHAGGISELQQLTGARVAASPWTANVMRKGMVPKDDPQFGVIIPIAKVARVEEIKDSETLTAGTVKVTAHFTPGHTPGGTTWTWQSCEKGRCVNLLYADSLTPASAEGFLFSRNTQYPRVVDDYKASYAFLKSAPCDILITAHPEFANLFERLAQRESNPDAMIDSGACRALAESSRERWDKRLASEREK